MLSPQKTGLAILTGIVTLWSVVTMAQSDNDADKSPAESYQWQIPEWLPPPPVPLDNPMSESKVQLGRHLFYDKRLSPDSTVACATCHEQARGFSDGRVRSRGINDTEAVRNSMTLANVGYLPVLTWGNPHMKSLEFQSLEFQSLVPLFGDEPPEMGNNGQEAVLFERLQKDDYYIQAFSESFSEHQGEMNLATLTRALAAFQRTLISVNSHYDKYKYGVRFRPCSVCVSINGCADNDIACMGT